MLGQPFFFSFFIVLVSVSPISPASNNSRQYGGEPSRASDPSNRPPCADGQPGIESPSRPPPPPLCQQPPPSATAGTMLDIRDSSPPTSGAGSAAAHPGAVPLYNQRAPLLALTISFLVIMTHFPLEGCACVYCRSGSPQRRLFSVEF